MKKKSQSLSIFGIPGISALCSLYKAKKDKKTDALIHGFLRGMAISAGGKTGGAIGGGTGAIVGNYLANKAISSGGKDGDGTSADKKTTADQEAIGGLYGLAGGYLGGGYAGYKLLDALYGEDTIKELYED